MGTCHECTKTEGTSDNDGDRLLPVAQGTACQCSGKFWQCQVTEESFLSWDFLGYSFWRILGVFTCVTSLVGSLKSEVNNNI